MFQIGCAAQYIYEPPRFSGRRIPAICQIQNDSENENLPRRPRLSKSGHFKQQPLHNCREILMLESMPFYFRVTSPDWRNPHLPLLSLPELADCNRWAMEGMSFCRCSPGQTNVAEKGTGTETIIGTSAALIRIGSIYKMLTCQLILTWLFSEWPDFSLELRCGVSLCRPMHLGPEDLARGNGALSQHPTFQTRFRW
jgi:hypothetical protein